MEGALAALLSRMLARYIKHIDSKQVKTKILSGRAALVDLNLKRSAFSDLGVPIHITRGVIRRVDLEVPMSANGKVTARVDGVLILGGISDIEPWVLRNKNADEDAKKVLVDYLWSRKDVVIDVENVHTRLAADIADETVVMGIMIRRLSSLWEENVSKEDGMKWKVSGLSVYVDVTKECADGEALMEMEDTGKDHAFVVKDLEFEMNIMIPGKDEGGHIEVSAKIPAVDVILRQQIGKTTRAVMSMLGRFGLSGLSGRPLTKTKSDVMDWWRFTVHHESRKRRFVVPNVLSFLKNRKLGEAESGKLDNVVVDMIREYQTRQKCMDSILPVIVDVRVDNVRAGNNVELNDVVVEWNEKGFQFKMDSISVSSSDDTWSILCCCFVSIANENIDVDISQGHLRSRVGKFTGVMNKISEWIRKNIMNVMGDACLGMVVGASVFEFCLGEKMQGIGLRCLCNGVLEVAKDHTNVTVEVSDVDFSRADGYSRVTRGILVKGLVSKQDPVETVTIVASDVLFSMTNADIAAIVMLIREIQKTIGNDIVVPRRYLINADGAKLTIVQTIYTPIISVGFREFELAIDMNGQTGQQITFSPIEVFNVETGLFDTLVEPFALDICFNNKRVAVNTVDSVNVNLGVKAIKTLTAEVKLLKTILDGNPVPELRQFRILNRTGMRMNVMVARVLFVIEPMEFADVGTLDVQTNICLSNMADGCSFTLASLEGGRFIRANMAAFVRSRESVAEVVITSLFKVKNETGIPLTLSVREFQSCRRIADIAPGKITYVTFYEQMKGVFAVSEVSTSVGKFSTFFQLRGGFKKGNRVIISTRNGPIKILFSTRFNHLKNVFTLCLAAQAKIYNCLPVGVYLTVDERSIYIEKNYLAHVSCIDTSAELCQCRIRIDGDVPSAIQELLFEGRSRLDIKIKLTGGMLSIACNSYRDPVNDQVVMRLYCPTIVYNKTKMALVGLDRKSGTFFRTDQDGMMMYGTPGYFKDPAHLLLDIVTVACGRTNKVPIDLTRRGRESVFVEIENERSVPIAYTIVSAEPYCPSVIVTLFACLEMKNELDVEIGVYPLDKSERKIVIAPGQSAELDDTTMDFKFSVTVSGHSESIVVDLADSQRTAIFMPDGRIAELAVDSSGTTTSCCFRSVVFPSEIMISNMLTDVVVAARSTSGAFRAEVAPLSTTSMVFDNPCSTRVALLSVGDNPFEVNVCKIGAVSHIVVGDKELYAKVELNSNGTRSIVIREAMPTPEVVSIPKFDITISLSRVVVSLITEHPTELAICIADGVTLKSCHDTERANISFCVHSLRVEDVHPDASVLVVVEGGVQRFENFLDLSVSWYKSVPMFTALDNVSLKIQDLNFYLDVSFVSDIAMWFVSLFPEVPKGVKSLNASEKQEGLGSVMHSCLISHIQVEPITTTLYIINKTLRNSRYTKTVGNLQYGIPCISGKTVVLSLPVYEYLSANYGYVRDVISYARRLFCAEMVGVMHGRDPMPINVSFGETWAHEISGPSVSVSPRSRLPTCWIKLPVHNSAAVDWKAALWKGLMPQVEDEQVTHEKEFCSWVMQLAEKHGDTSCYSTDLILRRSRSSNVLSRRQIRPFNPVNVQIQAFVKNRDKDEDIEAIIHTRCYIIVLCSASGFCLVSAADHSLTVRNKFRVEKIVSFKRRSVKFTIQLVSNLGNHDTSNTVSFKVNDSDCDYVDSWLTSKLRMRQTI